MLCSSAQGVHDHLLHQWKPDGGIAMPESETTTTATTASDFAALTPETQAIWEQNAGFWDDQMGEGNEFQRILIATAAERLLGLQVGERVVEAACGNGVFSRRMAALGAQVVASDFSPTFVERARA